MIRCSRCHSLSSDDSRFCTSCGIPFAAAPVMPPVKSKTNPLTIGAIVLGVLFSCAICGIIGKLGDTSKKSPGAESSPGKNITALSQTPVPASSPEPANAAPRTLSSQPSNKSKTAIVITDTASLLDAPKPNGAVIKELSEGTNIEVIKQKGAWFYVSADGQKGWMHGNAIRYESINPKITAEKNTPPSTPNPTYSERPKVSQKTPEPEIDNSGATARCRDGSLSYSAHRRGTCSHHGGVAVWY